MTPENTPPDPEPVEDAPQPETTPAEAVKPAEPEERFNKSEEVRRIIKRHPDWSYRKIQRYFVERHDTTITTSTIHRAKTTLGRMKGKPRPAGAGIATLVRNQFDVKHLAEAMAKCVTPSDINLITRKIVEKAVAGDLKAAELLFNRLWGKPREHLTQERTTTTLDLKALSNDDLDRLEAIMNKTGGPMYPALPAEAVMDAEVVETQTDTNNPEADGPTEDQ